MIMILTKIKDEMVAGNPKWKVDAQGVKRVDTISYSFISNVLITDMPRSQFYDAVYDWFLNCVRLPIDNIRDLTLPCDVDTGLLGINFTLICDDNKKELTEKKYAAEVKWCVQANDGSTNDIVEQFPWESQANSYVEAAVDAIDIEDVAFMLSD